MKSSEAKTFFRACPECGGEVHTVASKCKHCGIELRAAEPEPEPEPEPAPEPAPAPPLESAVATVSPPVRTALPPTAPSPPPAPSPTTPPASTTPPAPSLAPPPQAPRGSRWLLFGAAVLLVAIGMALGVLIERASHPQPTAAPAHASRTLTAPRALIPDSEPPDDFGFDIDPAPSRPGFSLRFQPFAPRRSGPSGAEPTVEQFAHQLGDELCAKLTDCTDVDPAVAMICRTIASQIDASELAGQVARGECSYDATAAATCVDGLAAVDCGADQRDPFAMMRTVEAVMACLEAVRCGGW